jgi:hypothetical protein
MEHPNLVVVHTYATRPEAELAKVALENAGIPAMTQGDTAGGMRDHLAWSGEGFKVWVREDDAVDAHELLNQLAAEPVENDPDDPGPNSE